MQVVKKGVLFLGVLWISIILFTPKQELYYLLEQRLQNMGIVLNEAQLEEKAFGLKLRNVKLYVEGIDTGEIKEINLWTLLLYTQVDFSGFSPSSAMLKITDIRLSKMQLSYALWDPRHIKIEAEGNFGKIIGDFNLQKQILRLRWIKIGAINSLKPYLKRDKKGWYYEQKL